MESLKVCISERERNFCEDDTHKPSENRADLFLNTRDNELDEVKPLDEAKLAQLLTANKAALESGLKVLELGEVQLTPTAVQLIADCGAKQVKCMRFYDCSGWNDENLKLLGQRFGKSVRDLELVGPLPDVTDAGVKALLASIGNLEALHLDRAIAVLADYSGTITNLRHVWCKVASEDLDKFSAFTVKYAPYLRHLDVTLSSTKEKTPNFVKLIANLNGLTKLSITSTSNVSIETELKETLAKLAPSLTSLNLCVWQGGDETLKAIGQLTKLTQLTLNGRSPMRHIDFRPTLPIGQVLKPLTQLKHLRLILKNHGKELLNGLAAGLPQLGTLELEGLDIDDASLQGLHGLKSLVFLDLVSPQMTDAGLVALIAQLPSITLLRLNDFGSEANINVKTLDAVASEARKRPDTPIEVVFTPGAHVDVQSRQSSLPKNLTASLKGSTHLLAFPGCTPRGF